MSWLNLSWPWIGPALLDIDMDLYIMNAVSLCAEFGQRWWEFIAWFVTQLYSYETNHIFTYEQSPFELNMYRTISMLNGMYICFKLIYVQRKTLFLQEFFFFLHSW